LSPKSAFGIPVFQGKEVNVQDIPCLGHLQHSYADKFIISLKNGHAINKQDAIFQNCHYGTNLIICVKEL